MGTSFSRFTDFLKERLPSNMGVHGTCIHTAAGCSGTEEPGTSALPGGEGAHTTSAVRPGRPPRQALPLVLSLTASPALGGLLCVGAPMASFGLAAWKALYSNKTFVCMIFPGKCEMSKEQVRDVTFLKSLPQEAELCFPGEYR